MTEFKANIVIALLTCIAALLTFIDMHIHNIVRLITPR